MSIIQKKKKKKSQHNYLTAKIPKSQNPLTISDNNNLDTPLRPVFQHFKNLTPAKTKFCHIMSRVALICT